MNRHKYYNTIKKSKLSIYDLIDKTNVNFWIPTKELEKILNRNLKNHNLGGYPLRTRSKVVKQEICRILGYPIPDSFQKTQPRFPGQDFDTYIQKSNNLQIWNEEVSMERRYVIIKLDEDDFVVKVKVITGKELAKYDTTGTLTQKYQAKINSLDTACNLLSDKDTENLKELINDKFISLTNLIPTDNPNKDSLISIKVIFEKLKTLIGKKFVSLRADQERNRGYEIHKIVCDALGYISIKDDGSFPDIKNQLIEVKFQTSPTIDLGLIRPDSNENLRIPKIDDIQIKHSDIRYLIIYGTIDEKFTFIKQINLVTGEEFFKHFPLFGGKILNKKLQLRLPDSLF